MFTRERHRRGVVYFGPYASAKKVRETLDVLNRVFPYRPCEGPQPGRHSGIPCLDYHIDRCLAPCVGYVSQGGLPRDHRRRDRVPDRARRGPILRRARARRCTRPPSAQEFEEAARYRNRLFVGPPPGRAAGRRQARDRHGRRDRPRRERRRRRRCRCSRCATAGSSTGTRSTSRTRPAEDVPELARGVLPRVLRERAGRSRRRSSSRARPATTGRSRSTSPSCAARASRFAPPSAARSGACQELAQQNAELALEQRRAAAASASACAASRRSRSSARRSTSRACRCGSSASTSRTSRTSRPSARWSSSRTPCPKKAHYRKFGIRRAAARTTSR